MASVPKITVYSDKNKEVKFLYNKMLDAVKQFKTGATFNNGSHGSIEIPKPPKGFIEHLKELKIDYEA